MTILMRGGAMSVTFPGAAVPHHGCHALRLDRHVQSLQQNPGVVALWECECARVVVGDHERMETEIRVIRVIRPLGVVRAERAEVSDRQGSLTADRQAGHSAALPDDLR